jgi:hypothetical protein
MLQFSCFWITDVMMIKQVSKILYSILYCFTETERADKLVKGIHLYSGIAKMFCINWKARAEDNLKTVVTTIYYRIGEYKSGQARVGCYEGEQEVYTTKGIYQNN